MPTVAALIIDRNRPAETRRAIQSIKKQTFKDVIIRKWDNSEVNWGVAIPSNLFAENEECKYLFFLDNDAYLTDENYLQTLVDFMDKTPDAAVVFGKSKNPDGTDQWISMLNVKGHRGGEKTGSFNGSGCLVRRDAFLEVGGYDPIYFAYYLETDLAARLYRDHWGVYIFNELSLIHEETKKARVSSQVLYLMTRNHYMFHLLHMPWRYAIPQCAKWVVWSLIHSKGDLITVMKAHYGVIKKIPSLLRDRQPTNEPLILEQWSKLLR